MESHSDRTGIPSHLFHGVSILRVILGAMFVIAGVTKLIFAEEFADSIAAFDLLPTWLINSVAAGLPIFEIAVGVLTFFKPAKGVGPLAIFLLGLVFLLVTLQAMVRGIAFDCRCFALPLPGQPWSGLGIRLGTLWAAAILFRYDSAS